jgi:hypothetical protein
MAVAISFVFLLPFPLLAQSQEFDPFIYHGFNGSEETITREGASIIKPSGALRLTNTSQNVAGHSIPKKIQIIDTKSPSYPNVSSFNTSFVFAIVTSLENIFLLLRLPSSASSSSSFFFFEPIGG